MNTLESKELTATIKTIQIGKNKLTLSLVQQLETVLLYEPRYSINPNYNIWGFVSTNKRKFIIVSQNNKLFKADFCHPKDIYRELCQNFEYQSHLNEDCHYIFNPNNKIAKLKKLNSNLQEESLKTHQAHDYFIFCGFEFAIGNTPVEKISWYELRDPVIFMKLSELIKKEAQYLTNMAEIFNSIVKNLQESEKIYDSMDQIFI